MTKRMPMLVHRDSETPRDDLYMLRQGAMHGSFTASSLPELKSSVLGSTQPKITQQQDSCPPPISFKSSFDRFGIQNPSTHQCRMLSENGPVFGSGDQADSSSQQYDTLSFGHPFQMIHGSLSLQNTFNFEHSHVNPSQLQHNEASNYPECFGNTAPGAVQGYEAQNMPHGAGYGDLSRNYLLSDPLAVNTEKSRSTTPLSVQNDDLVDNEESREEPPYNKLIYQCLKDAAPDYQRQLQEIYEWFRRNTNKGQDPKLKGWQNSIRHNLSMNDAFVKVPDPHRKNLWRLSSEVLQSGRVEPTTRFRSNNRTGGRRAKSRVRQTATRRLAASGANQRIIRQSDRQRHAMKREDLPRGYTSSPQVNTANPNISVNAMPFAPSPSPYFYDCQPILGSNEYMTNQDGIIKNVWSGEHFSDLQNFRNEASADTTHIDYVRGFPNVCGYNTNDGVVEGANVNKFNTRRLEPSRGFNEGNQFTLQQVDPLYTNDYSADNTPHLMDTDIVGMDADARFGPLFTDSETDAEPKTPETRQMCYGQGKM